MSPRGWDYDGFLGVFHAGHAFWTDDPRWSAVIHMVHGDLSGDEKGILVAGCYLGLEDQWMDAIAAWCSALDDAGVEEFHATDFYSARGHFDDDRWRHYVEGKGMVPGGELHNEFAERFCGIPCDKGLTGFAHAIDTPAFKEILEPELRKEKRRHTLGHPRTFAAVTAVDNVNKFLADTKYRVKGKIQIIFEREKGGERFRSYFDESLNRKEKWTYWFDSFTTKSKDFPPLQMADLLAHEALRRMRRIWSKDGTEPGKHRKSFERLLRNRSILLTGQNRKDLTKSAASVRATLARYPNGLVPPTEKLLDL